MCVCVCVIRRLKVNVTHFLLSLPPGVRLRNYKNNVKCRREHLQNLNPYLHFCSYTVMRRITTFRSMTDRM